MPVPSELRLFCLLEQLAGAKTSQLTLKSLNFVRPITLEVARSSPVASSSCCFGIVATALISSCERPSAA